MIADKKVEMDSIYKKIAGAMVFSVATMVGGYAFYSVGRIDTLNSELSALNSLITEYKVGHEMNEIAHEKAHKGYDTFITDHEKKRSEIWRRVDANTNGVRDLKDSLIRTKDKMDVLRGVAR